MTDRYSRLTVALEADIREDDAEELISAIGMLRGVARVAPHVVDEADFAARARIRAEVGEKLLGVLHPPLAGRR